MALVSQDSSAIVFSSLLAPFTGVNNATVRLLKAISATELATLREGDLVYVMSVRDYWKWLPNSVLTDDSATEVTICAPTVVGAGAGRFERMLFASPDWMSFYANTDCVIDAAVSLVTTSNENDGLTAATALRTDTERQRRMGLDPPMVAGAAYHYRYISNVPAAQQVLIRTNPASGAQIFIHGSMTDKTGQSTIFSGLAGTITAENYAAGAGGQPWEMICATIPVSWTASGCVNKRGRFTSGANNGGLFWIIKDLGGAAPNAKARLSEPQATVIFTAPFTTTNGTFTPVAGASFVIETLTQIPNFEIHTVGGELNTVTTGIILDSVDIGTGGQSIWSTTRGIAPWGCTFGSFGVVNLAPTATIMGCQFNSGNTPTFNSVVINNSYNTVAQTFKCLLSGNLVRHMAQGNAVVRLSCPRGAVSGFVVQTWTISQLGLWDISGFYPLQILDNAYLLSTGTLWGNGFTAATNITPILLARGAKLMYGAADNALPASYFYVLAPTTGVNAGGWVACGEDSSEAGGLAVRGLVPAYDKVLGFTVDTLLSPANLQATVAAGGFGGYFFDPVTSCSMGQT